MIEAMSSGVIVVEVASELSSFSSVIVLDSPLSISKVSRQIIRLSFSFTLSESYRLVFLIL